MAGGFAITTTTTSAKLPTNRQGQFQFTVTNASGRQLTVRGKVVAQTPEQTAWFTIEGPTERLCAPNATLSYIVDVAIPATAPATPITFHLDAIGVENPDEYNSQGPAIVLEVPPASMPKKPFPWWIVAVSAVAILLLGGGSAFAYYLVHKDDKPVAKASATPTPTPSPTPDPIAKFVGTWVGSIDSQTGSGVTRLVIRRQGSTLLGTFEASCKNYPCGYVDAPGTYDPPLSRVTFKWSSNGPISGNDAYTVYASINPNPPGYMTLVVTSAKLSQIGVVRMTKTS